MFIYATVCGFSKRLRLDITVNKLTYDAFYKKKFLWMAEIKLDPIYIYKRFYN